MVKHAAKFPCTPIFPQIQKILGFSRIVGKADFSSFETICPVLWLTTHYQTEHEILAPEMKPEIFTVLTPKVSLTFLEDCCESSSGRSNNIGAIIGSLREKYHQNCSVVLQVMTAFTRLSQKDLR